MRKRPYVLRNKQNCPQEEIQINPQTQNPHGAYMLQHVSLAFPSPRRYACITVVNRAI